MKIALLVCDHVPEDLQPNHGTYPHMFTRLFDLSMDIFYVCDGIFPEVNKYDAFICTGSRFSVYDDIPWIIKLKHVTRSIYQAGKKFIGVCFGHQMIGYALGGKVEQSEHGFLIGIHRFNIHQTAEWMKPLTTQYHVLMLCQDQVTQLPDGGIILASSAQCQTGLYTVGRNFLGIQGHPEFTNAYNRELFERRLRIDDLDKKSVALKSFREEKADRTLLAGFLRNFLQS